MFGLFSFRICLHSINNEFEEAGIYVNLIFVFEFKSRGKEIQNAKQAAVLYRTMSIEFTANKKHHISYVSAEREARVFLLPYRSAENI